MKLKMKRNFNLPLIYKICYGIVKKEDIMKALDTCEKIWKIRKEMEGKEE